MNTCINCSQENKTTKTLVCKSCRHAANNMHLPKELRVLNKGMDQLEDNFKRVASIFSIIGTPRQQL